MTIALWLGGAFVLGFSVRQLGLPPLVGFLLAGFAFRALGFEVDNIIETLSHIGVLILLFVVGLKVRLLTLIRPEVWATGLVHMGLFVLIVSYLLITQSGIALSPAAGLAAGLAFSSTVVAATMLENRRELRSFHGRVAIGILIVQDLVAVAILASDGSHKPSVYAAGLLALPLLRPLFTRLLDKIGHDELLVLYGMVLALTFGGWGFEAVGLSPELGALVMGTLLADHPKAKELGDVLWGIKEFLLVGFFLSIGLAGLPTLDMIGISLLLMLLIPVKTALFIFLLVLFGLRARTAFLAALSLASFSEFGLIVTKSYVSQGMLDPDWLIIAAVTVSFSFVLVAPLNRAAHSIYEWLEPLLSRFEGRRRHPDDQPVSLGSAEYVIVGMGRIGTAAYDYLHAEVKAVVGLENDPGKLGRHLNTGRRVVYADAEDPGFWHRLNIDRISAFLLALPDVEAKILAAEQLRARGFSGLITATHIYSDEQDRICQAGCDFTYNNFAEAGVGFASHTYEVLEQRKADSSLQIPQPAPEA